MLICWYGYVGIGMLVLICWYWYVDIDNNVGIDMLVLIWDLYWYVGIGFFSCVLDGYVGVVYIGMDMSVWIWWYWYAGINIVYILAKHAN